MKTTTRRHCATAVARTALLACAMVIGHAAARADGGHIGRAAVLPAYAQECGACHIAYAPALLPAASWLRVMRSLSDHYGADASLDAATNAQLSAWLVANAATSGRRFEEPPADRITRAAWFARKHREVSPAAWQRPAVKSPANCAACHTQADQGDFDEHRVRIPR